MLDINKRAIGNFQLEDYQSDAISLMYEKIYEIITKKNNRNELLLHAPVGSGKTVMGAFMVNFMKKQMEELGLDLDYTFFWISPDTGGINQQSKKTFDTIIKNVDPIDIQEALSQRTVLKNQILFMNWEKIGKTGNKLLEDTETTNLKDITNGIQNYKILIIDEAHQNWEKGGAEAIEMIGPDLTIHLTATPDKRLKSLPNQNKIFIDYSAPQNAGVIKKVIKYNHGINDDVDFEEDQVRNSNNKIDLLDIEQMLIKKAIDKRNELEKEVSTLNENYLYPLVIIQIPNTKAIEKVTSDYVLNFLMSQGIEEKEIAIWLAEEKKNVENLETSEVKYIVTKQAITTGWDCPRAHVLVKLRETKSVKFDLQTLGRIMRIPRGYKFDSEKLQTAYVYSPYEEYSYADESEREGFRRLLKTNQYESLLKQDFVDQVGKLGIPMYKSNKIKEIFIDSGMLYNYLKNELMKIDFSSINSEVAFARIKSEESIDINEENMTGTTKLDEGISKIPLSYNDLKGHYKYKMSEYSKVTDIGFFVSKIILDIVADDKESFETSYSKLYTVFYNEEERIHQAITNAIKKYRKDDNIVRTLTNNYEVVEKVYLGEIKDKASDVYSYDKEPGKEEYDSTPEEKFATFLNNNRKNINYWFKNQVGQEHFSITYEFDNVVKEYYPDFIVFDKNGNMLILDTKANFGDDDFKDTEAKFLEGVKYKEDDKVKRRISELGFKKLYFSVIKYQSNDSQEPYILLKDKWSDNIMDWEKFENIIQ